MLRGIQSMLAKLNGEPDPIGPRATSNGPTDLDQVVEQYFARYDLDGSGTLNSREELEQLATNLSFKLKIPSSAMHQTTAAAFQCVDDVIDESNAWDVNDFKEW